MGHRKQVRHYHEPGHLHEFTFSCYQRRPLLTNDDWRGRLARTLDTAGEEYRFQLVAFLFMPEHVQLLTYPLDESPTSAAIWPESSSRSQSRSKTCSSRTGPGCSRS